MLIIRSRAILSFVTGCIVALAAAAPLAAGQDDVSTPVPRAVAASAPTAAQASDDDDAVLDSAEPDFRVINLPTTMRLPRTKGNFTLTHRFAGNLRRGSFSDQASQLFGIDEGATVGFEYRFGIARHLEVTAYRVSFQQTIQLHAKYDALHQSGSLPVSVSAIVSDEGTNNFQDQHAPAIGLSISRKVSNRLAVYVVPVWVHNSAANTGVTLNTTYIGVGSRLRIRPTVYVSGEVSPRASGYEPGTSEFAFAIEKRAGGHFFQLNFSNTSGSTFAQVARGGQPQSLSLGFNLIRKFY